MKNDKYDVILDNMLNKFCKAKPSKLFRENFVLKDSSIKNKRKIDLRIVAGTAVAACITVIMVVFMTTTNTKPNRGTGLSKEVIAAIDENIKDYKVNFMIGTNQKGYSFKTEDELVYFINNAELNREKFRMFYDLKSVLIPKVPESWGELDYINLDTRGILSFLYKSDNPVPIPYERKYNENPYGITPVPSPTPMPVDIFYNTHHVTIWTIEKTDLFVENYISNSIQENWVTLNNGTEVYLKGNGVTWFHKMKYMMSVWDSDGDIINDANKTIFKSIKLNLN